MTDKEVLQKVFEISCKNGHFILDMINEDEWEKCLKNKTYRTTIFSHGFAKAFFGEEGVSVVQIDGQKLVNWQYQLQQLVIAENRINYLRQFLIDYYV